MVSMDHFFGFSLTCHRNNEKQPNFIKAVTQYFLSLVRNGIQIYNINDKTIITLRTDKAIITLSY